MSAYAPHVDQCGETLLTSLPPYYLHTMSYSLAWVFLILLGLNLRLVSFISLYALCHIFL